METGYLDNNVTLTVTKDYSFRLTPLPGWGLEKAVEMLESSEHEGGSWVDGGVLWGYDEDAKGPVKVATVECIDVYPLVSKARIHG